MSRVWYALKSMSTRVKSQNPARIQMCFPLAFSSDHMLLRRHTPALRLSVLERHSTVGGRLAQSDSRPVAITQH